MDFVLDDPVHTSSGRILCDTDQMRYVELSASYDSPCYYNSIELLLAGFDDSSVLLYRLFSGGTISQIRLTDGEAATFFRAFVEFATRKEPNSQITLETLRRYLGLERVDDFALASRLAKLVVILRWLDELWGYLSLPAAVDQIMRELVSQRQPDENQ